MGNKRDMSKYTQIGGLLFNLNYLSAHTIPDPDPNSTCTLWNGAKHRQGYGMMGGIRAADNHRFMTVVHRVIGMVKWNRELASDEFVIHTCSNPKCTNPDHLILGDHSKRNEIMYSNGRGPKNQGTNKVRGVTVKQNRKYKYSEAEILWCRTAAVPDICKKYGLDTRQANALRAGMRKGFKWLK